MFEADDLTGVLLGETLHIFRRRWDEVCCALSVRRTKWKRTRRRRRRRRTRMRIRSEEKVQGWHWVKLLPFFRIDLLHFLFHLGFTGGNATDGTGLHSGHLRVLHGDVLGVVLALCLLGSWEV